ncbi:MAG: OmpA family protein [Candidatus Obscuribacterales bacterium]|nr:OmpA family protein [Candidatus Obscuribacterales bacterium]
MKIELLSTGLLALALTVFNSSIALGQSKEQMDRINRNWGNIDQQYKNLNKQYETRELQKPGEIQKAGEIQIPRGFKAITQKAAPCSQRFTVGADTLFEFDKATLTPFAMETLNALKPLITKLGKHPIKVEGHTDGKGSDDYNQNLSERRAERVKNWLIEKDISPASAISIEGFGEKRPVARNQNPDGSDNPQGRALNRRVEIVVDTCKEIETSKAEAQENKSTGQTSNN